MRHSGDGTESELVRNREEMCSIQDRNKRRIIFELTKKIKSL